VLIKVIVMGEQKVFIRHPDEFPIELDLQESHPTLTDTSQLQLICHSTKPFQSGESIAIKIPSVASQLEVNGTVERCEDTNDGYELGITFNSLDALARIRMLEQLCYIQRYRNHVLKVEGRVISTQDAALEWIGKYAHLFPCEEESTTP
jgi:hypothetical protein|tara:strand:- start:1499 stop:1945 length:447 start_codon:yes stop_codon:yes gene_type:complete